MDPACKLHACSLGYLWDAGRFEIHINEVSITPDSLQTSETITVSTVQQFSCLVFKTESVSRSGTKAELGPKTSVLVSAGAQSQCVSFVFVAQCFTGFSLSRREASAAVNTNVPAHFLPSSFNP